MSTNISSYYRNPMRITSLSSGLDTDSIVAQLTQLEQAKIDKVYQSKTKSQWKLDAYNDINTELKNFREKYMSVLSESNLYSSSAYKKYVANYATNNYFKVTASSNVIPGNYNVSQVSLANYAKITGNRGANRTAEMSSGNSMYMGTTVESGEMKIAGGGLATETTQLSAIVNANGSSAFGFDGGTSEISFQINGKAVKLNSGDTIQDMLNKINNESNTTNVNATFANGKVTFATTGTGTKGTINFANVVGTAFGGTKSDGTVIPGGFADLKAGTQKQELRINGSTMLTDLQRMNSSTYFDNDGKLEFTINGELFSFRPDMTVQEMQDEINNRTAANVKMFINPDNGRMTLRATNATATDNGKVEVKNVKGKFFGADGLTGINEGKNTKGTINGADTLRDVARKMNGDPSTLGLDSNGKFSFKINDVEFSFDASENLSQIIAKVNNSSAGVRMAYSELTDSFTFTSTAMGADAELKLENVDGAKVFDADGLFNTTAMTAQGTDASITISVNGEPAETITQSSNNFTIDGMNFTLTGAFDATADPNKTYNISFSQDVDAVVETMKSFIEDYNTLINKLDGLYKEKKQRDYTPLTAAQKEVMTEKEIELWESKAKSGILRSDSSLNSLLSQLRNNFFGGYDHVTKQSMTGGIAGAMSYDIGISTAFMTTSGELQLDEEKFRDALQEDPNRVTQIMAGISYSTDETTKFQESGIMTRLANSINEYSKVSRNTVIKNQTEMIRDYDDKIKELTEKMYEKEQGYWRQFSYLEQLMTQMNSQTNWLNQQLGAM